MDSVSVNNEVYPARKVSCKIDPLKQDNQLRKGRVVLSYDLIGNNIAAVKLFLKKDDSIKKLVKTFWLSAYGLQSIDALMFDSIEIDQNYQSENIHMSFNGYNLLKNE